jgi:3-oxoacyl-[acyl-carrier protein] reductase
LTTTRHDHWQAEYGAQGLRAVGIHTLLGERHIPNAVAPGVVETDVSKFTETDAGRDFALGMQAFKRLAQPDDIGSVVGFLASGDARWITGATIHADGGSKF